MNLSQFWLKFDAISNQAGVHGDDPVKIIGIDGEYTVAAIEVTPDGILIHTEGDDVEVMGVDR